ncbi:MAG: (d)CMP kinase [Gemmatimonadetes bacterium]|nr:(d)CMP kinase [Gemmatimonadota bacterium]
MTAGTLREASEGPVVTLDGPAGSGKSSTAKAVARVLGYRHLDSGALYRALTLALLQAGIDADRWPGLSEEFLLALDVDMRPTDEGFALWVGGAQVDAELRTQEVTDHVSHLARLPAVRRSLLDLQRRAGSRGRLVADGRDMGTVVFPDAEVKVYLIADVEERARRRLLEQGGAEGDEVELALQIEAITDRDRRDSERDISPLRKAPDAHEIDTTGLDFLDQVDAVVARVRRLTLS